MGGGGGGDMGEKNGEKKKTAKKQQQISVFVCCPQEGVYEKLKETKSALFCLVTHLKELKSTFVYVMMCGLDTGGHLSLFPSPTRKNNNTCLGLHQCRM